MGCGAYYNDIDPYVCAWVENLIQEGVLPPGDVDCRSIIDVQPDDLAGYRQHHFFVGVGGWPFALELAGWPRDRPVWTASVPCQPLSSAGRRQGHADERHLWPDLYALIAALRPAVCFGEQVASPLGREWLAGVRADLADVGYAVGAADLAAASVGAPHRRQRLFWVAHTDGRYAGAERLQRGGQHGLEPSDGRPGGGLDVSAGERRSVLERVAGAGRGTAGGGTQEPQRPGATERMAKPNGLNGRAGLDAAERHGPEALDRRGLGDTDGARPPGHRRSVEDEGEVEARQAGARSPVADADSGRRGTDGLSRSGADDDRGGPVESHDRSAAADAGASGPGPMGDSAERGVGTRQRQSGPGSGAREQARRSGASGALDDPEGERRGMAHASEPGQAVGEVHAPRHSGDASGADRMEHPDGERRAGGRVHDGQWRPGEEAPHEQGTGFWDGAILIECTDGKARRTEPRIHPLAYGVPVDMGSDRPGEASPHRVIRDPKTGRSVGQVPWRIGMLRGYGNAIVPECAALFIEAYCTAELD